MKSAAARTASRGRVLWLWFGLVVALALAYVVAQTVRTSTSVRPHALVAAILAGPALVLGWLAWLVARTELPGVVRLVVAAALGYHALFGPSMLLTRTLREASSNDELVMRAWPHVVHWINSFE